MTVANGTAALKPPDAGGARPPGPERGRPRCLLVVLHTPSGEGVGAKLEIGAPVFRIGKGDDDLLVEGALQSGTSAAVVWTSDDETRSSTGWRVKGSGRLFVNGSATTDRQLTSGDELRVVDSFFRFLSGEHIIEKYHETIYLLTITDFASGALNKRYLAEILFREKERATRYRRQFSVASVTIEPNQGNQEGDLDLLRPIVRGLEERNARDWVIARAGSSELAVVAPGTALELQSYLVATVPRCMPENAQAQVGVVQYEADLDPEQLVRMARANATLLSG